MSVPKRHVAVVGSGPAGFFAVESLLKRPDIRVDLFERLAAPFGLVRYGVAPDHQKIKRVTAGFSKTARDERVRFFGAVDIGRDLGADELAAEYDQVVYATGCEAPRSLGVPGETLPGVHSALAFVSWYNAHPDYTAQVVDLNVSDVAVIGAGDVSMDVCRLLLSETKELGETDMPPYALAEFAKKRVRRLHVLVRRGPAEVGFAHKELRAVVERANVAVYCDLPLLRETLASELPNHQRSKLEYLLEIAQPAAEVATASGDGTQPQLHFHFLRSPVEFSGGDRLSVLRAEVNRLQERDGRVGAVGTGQYVELECQLAVLAVGYRGVPIVGVPFDPGSGLVPNVNGRVLRADGSVLAGHYVVGWLKRGPQGVIGTNKADARATVELMLEDLESQPAKPAPNTEALLQRREIPFLSFSDWEELDRLELERGTACKKPREKWLSAADALAALGRNC